MASGGGQICHAGNDEHIAASRKPQSRRPPLPAPPLQRLNLCVRQRHGTTGRRRANAGLQTGRTQRTFQNAVPNREETHLHGRPLLFAPHDRHRRVHPSNTDTLCTIRSRTYIQAGDALCWALLQVRLLVQQHISDDIPHDAHEERVVQQAQVSVLDAHQPVIPPSPSTTASNGSVVMAATTHRALARCRGWLQSVRSSERTTATPPAPAPALTARPTPRKATLTI